MSADPWEQRVPRLEGAMTQIADRLNGLDMRFETLQRRLDSTRDGLTSKIDALQWRMTALILGTWITTIAVVLFHR